MHNFVWVAAPGFYACMPELSPPYNEPHWHPETHEDWHKMGKERNASRHCLERGCPYREVLVRAAVAELQRDDDRRT